MTEVEILKQKVQHIIDCEFPHIVQTRETRGNVVGRICNFLSEMNLQIITVQCDYKNNPYSVINSGGLILDITVVMSDRTLQSFKVGYLDQK